jgi:tetraacyldisaccharide 4'-kinase
MSAMDRSSDSSSREHCSLLRRALGLPYACAMRLRNWAYAVGLAKSYAAETPVICVGNITTGGTGKTPMVAWVVRQLRLLGRQPAILTRGYKATGGKSDEAELLKNLTAAEVVVNPDRRAGAAAAVAAGADVLVMDDGFQHRRLRRDLDIVLIDATRPFGYGACLPAGRLREPLCGLRRAGAIVITRGDQVSSDRLADLRDRLQRLAPQATLAVATHKPTGIIDEAGQTQPADSLVGRRVMLFCGLGNPEAFTRSAEALGAQIVGSCALADHVEYTPAVVRRICEAGRKAQAQILLTTQKDGVKVSAGDFSLPIRQLAVEMDITEGEEALLEKIRGVNTE